MSSFDDLLRDTAAVFSEGLGEDVVYTPFNGTQRTIKAIVNRKPYEVIGPNGENLTPKLEILVDNSATTGISTATMDAKGADKVTVAIRKGDTAVPLGVYLPPPGSRRPHDAGMISLDLK